MTNSRLNLAALVAVSVLLVWRAFAVNLGDYDPGGRPRVPQSLERPSLLSALRQNPADVRTLLALSRDDTNGAPGRAAAELAAARNVAPREEAVGEMQAIDLARRGKVTDAAAVLSDITTRFEAYERTFPVFAQLLQAQDPSFQAIASRSPPWLGHFILVQCGKGLDPLLLAPLVQQLPGPREGLEVECVIERLRAAGQWPTAYQVWLNSLAGSSLGDVGFVFNGSFEIPPTGRGFDWRPDKAPERESGHSIEFAQSRERAQAHALRVAYNGKRQGSPAILQFLAVPPGHYELKGRVRVDALTSPRGVHWTVRCASPSNPAEIASSEAFRGSVPWRDFAFAVDVGRDCQGQVLALEPVGINEGTTFVSGSVWFDDISLRARR